MRVVLLAGGLGTRLAEETGLRPKPMVEIGGKPILWHIMNIYASHGHRDFVIACGYKAEVIKDYFANFYIHNSDYAVNLSDGKVDVISSAGVDWRVAVIDTGFATQTGGRLLRLREHVGDATFMITYGDGVGNIDVARLVEFHRAHGKLATVTGVRPPSRFGALRIEDGGAVSVFSEKSQTDAGWINGGYFVFEPGVFDYLNDDDTILERDPLERLAREGELMAFLHPGYWQPMDTLREKNQLEQLWASGQAPWKSWQ